MAELRRVTFVLRSPDFGTADIVASVESSRAQANNW
jgi:hypothetical protein